MIPFTCPCCEVAHPPHRDGCTLHDDCPKEAEVFDEVASLRAVATLLREVLQDSLIEIVCLRAEFDRLIEKRSAAGGVVEVEE